MLCIQSSFHCVINDTCMGTVSIPEWYQFLFWSPPYISLQQEIWASISCCQNSNHAGYLLVLLHQPYPPGLQDIKSSQTSTLKEYEAFYNNNMRQMSNELISLLPFVSNCCFHHLIWLRKLLENNKQRYHLQRLVKSTAGPWRAFIGTFSKRKDTVARTGLQLWWWAESALFLLSVAGMKYTQNVHSIVYCVCVCVGGGELTETE